MRQDFTRLSNEEIPVDHSQPAILDIQVGLLGQNIIDQMSEEERAKFYRTFNDRQEYYGKIVLEEVRFRYCIARRGDKATVLVTPPEPGNYLVFTEEEDYVSVLVARKVPETLRESLIGQTANIVCGSFDSLPALDSLVIYEAEAPNRYLNTKARTTWNTMKEENKMSDQDWIEHYRKDIDEEGYVPFNKDRRAGQNQYASRNVDGRLGATNLGEGLRWKFSDQGPSDYHDIRIHIDDLAEFHRRYQEDRKRFFGGS